MYSVHTICCTCFVILSDPLSPKYLYLHVQERKKKGETNTQLFLADVFAYQVYTKCTQQFHYCEYYD